MLPLVLHLHSNPMKSLISLSIAAFATLTLSAQKGQVNIQQDQKIEALLKVYKSFNSNAEYYRIQVGFGSYAKASRLKTKVETDFPLMPSKIDFDSPTYRVRLGRFKTRLEAERKFKEVRQKYPDAMLLKPKKSTR